MKVNILKEDLVFDEFFSIYKGKLQFEHFDGSMSEKLDRYTIRKSSAVAVLVYHVSKEAYILVRQFRYPLHYHKIDAWLTEIVAGGVEDDEDHRSAAEREVREETGYVPLRMEKITSCYVSPGILDERVTIFFAEVDDTSRVDEGGGAKEENEDIQLLHLPLKDAESWMQNQQYGDAKTIIALQWHIQKNKQT